MFFSSTIDLLEEYIQMHRVAESLQFDVDLAVELMARLRQVSYLYEQIMELSARLLARNQSARSDEFEGATVNLIFVYTPPPIDRESGTAGFPPVEDFSLDERIRLLVESFYYFAHRAVVLIRRSNGRLPGLKAFSPLGIIKVRNKLIEHPEAKEGVRLISLAVSEAEGVRLKPMRRSITEEGYVDLGLSRNAEEFRGKFEARLNDAFAA